MLPYLLLDVDGVLRPWGWGDRPSEFDITRNAERLQLLSSKFQIAWCTDWQESANDEIAPAHGLPKLPVVQSTGTYHAIHWKLDWIESFIDDQPYAFLDDDINDLGLLYASWRNNTIPTLWLPVDPAEGLNDRHVAQLEQFALSYSNGSAR